MNKEKFELIVKKFISKHGITAIIENTEILKEKVSEDLETWKCNINLRGGFSILIELVEETLYKDNQFYCNIDDLGDLGLKVEKIAKNNPAKMSKEEEKEILEELASLTADDMEIASEDILE